MHLSRCQIRVSNDAMEALEGSSPRVWKSSGLRRLLHANGEDRGFWLVIGMLAHTTLVKGLRCQAVLGFSSMCIVYL
jgi:hypothetical protein